MATKKPGPEPDEPDEDEDEVPPPADKPRTIEKPGDVPKPARPTSTTIHNP
jgi:hypothetical protein